MSDVEIVFWTVLATLGVVMAVLGLMLHGYEEGRKAERREWTGRRRDKTPQ